MRIRINSNDKCFKEVSRELSLRKTIKIRITVAISVAIRIRITLMCNKNKQYNK